MMRDQPSYMIGTVPIYGATGLAPMSGYNDQVFRRLCRRFGAALTYTGLLSPNSILYGPMPFGTPRSEDMLRFHGSEKPLICQLFGSQVEPLVEAACKIQNLGMDAIDLNIGCPDPKITKGGAGSALMQTPKLIGEIINALVKALDLPVTAKIRLGWDGTTRNYLEVSKIVEQSGAVMLAVHGRTTEQVYSGEADWDAIAEVKQAVSIPVLASGDVKAAGDIQRILAHTGCDGVLIGRSAVGNPWIFAGLDRDAVPWPERLPVLSEHLRDMLHFHGTHHGLIRFRKHLLGYMRNAGIPRRVRAQALTIDDPVALLVLLESCAPL